MLWFIILVVILWIVQCCGCEKIDEDSFIWLRDPAKPTHELHMFSLRYEYFDIEYLDVLNASLAEFDSYVVGAVSADSFRSSLAGKRT